MTISLEVLVPVPEAADTATTAGRVDDMRRAGRGFSYWPDVPSAAAALAAAGMICGSGA